MDKCRRCERLIEETCEYCDDTTWIERLGIKAVNRSDWNLADSNGKPFEEESNG